VPYELLNDHCEVILHITGYWPQSYILNHTLILHPLLYCTVLSYTLPMFCCHYFLCHTSCVRYTKKHCVLIYDTYVKVGSTRKIEDFGVNLRCRIFTYMGLTELILKGMLSRY